MLVKRAAALSAGFAFALILAQVILALGVREVTSGFVAANLLATLFVVVAVVHAARNRAERTVAARVDELCAFTAHLRVAPNEYAPLKPQGDELDPLVDEMNRLADQLRVAREQVAQERRARSRAERELRVADRLASIGKVASSIAHDLGTPLNVVSGQAELLAMAAEPDSRVAKAASTIHQQALHMSDIIRNVLGFARSRRMVPTQTAEPLAPIVDSVVRLCEPYAEESDVRVETRVTSSLRACVAPSSLVQALTNITQNAIQASNQDGWVVISGRAVVADSSAPRELKRGAEYAVVEISDNGVGMTEETLSRIFEPFYTTKDGEDGTGLGLAITTEIVNAHGGALAIQSEVGEGTTVSVWLPTSGSRRATSVSRTAPVSTPQQSAR